MAVMAYQTRDGLADYGFSINYQPGMGWRVYIVFRPFSQGPENGMLLPHEALDGDKRHYVDWPDKLDTLADAKTVAELWAELVQGYRRDQHVKARFEELVERYRRDQERKKAASAGESAPRPAAIPRPRVPAEWFDALPEGA